MPTAVLIYPDLTAHRINLPTNLAEHRIALRGLLGLEAGAAVDAVYYHPRNVFHVGGRSTSTTPANHAAWALACTWRGLRLNYPLHGPIVVTGPMEEASTAYSDLDDELADQAEQVTEIVRATAVSNPDGVTATHLLEAVRLP